MAEGLEESLRTIRELGRDLAELPEAIREAPARATAVSTPSSRPHGRDRLRRRTRRALRVVRWLVLVACVSAALALYVAQFVR